MGNTTLEINDETFGQHLLIDGYNGNFEKLSDPKLIGYLLEDLPALMNMHIINDPIVIEAGPNNKKDPGGYTGFVLIAESHISIHTFPKRGFISIDVYSCNQFNHKGILKLFEHLFELKNTEVSVIKRGLKYPKKDIY